MDTTEISPAAPIASMGKFRWSSPEYNSHLPRTSRAVCMICSILPHASLMPATLGISAILPMVAGWMLTPVRGGTL